MKLFFIFLSFISSTLFSMDPNYSIDMPKRKISLEETKISPVLNRIKKQGGSEIAAEKYVTGLKQQADFRITQVKYVNNSLEGCAKK